jgi:hypothetical protein
LRNYFSTFMGSFEAHGSGSSGSFDGTLYAIGSTEEDWMEQFRIVGADNALSFDPDWTWTYDQLQVDQFFWQFDQINFLKIVRPLAGYFVQGVRAITTDPTLIDLQKAVVLNDGDYNPRKGWTDIHGVRRKETPSDKGDPAYDLVRKEDDR